MPIKKLKSWLIVAVIREVRRIWQLDSLFFAAEDF
jgi:hypothetical protein